MLVLSRKLRESFFIGNQITVKVVRVDGDTVRLGIEAPREVAVHRTEIVQRFKEEAVQPCAA